MKPTQNPHFTSYNLKRKSVCDGLEPRGTTSLHVALLSLFEIDNIPDGFEILTSRRSVSRYGYEQSRNSHRPLR